MSAAPRAAAPAAGANPARRQEGGGIGASIKSALQVFVLVQLAQMGLKYFMGNSGGASQSSTGAANVSIPANKANQTHLVPLWEKGTVFDAHFYITAHVAEPINFDHPSLPHTSFSGLQFGNWSWKEHWDTQVPLPKNVQNNGTLVLNTILSRAGAPVNPRSPDFNPEEVHFTQRPLMQYQKLKRVRAVKNLISGESEVPEETEEEAAAKDKAMPIVSYYHPNITIAVVQDSAAYDPNALHPAIAPYFHARPAVSGSIHLRYPPIVWPNTFWQLKEASFPVNESVQTVPLHLKFEPIGVTKFQIFATLDDSFKNAANNPTGGVSAGDFDEIKRVFLETNPLLLGTTILVTVLHMLFEFLAFSSDVKHWRNQKSQVGVSVRTIITNIIIQLIITLYLFDNNQDTSWMILFSQGTGLLIEAWKITKAVDIRVVPRQGIIPYKIEFHDKHVLSQEEKDTKEYDALAFKWVGIATVPLLIGYTIYSLLYQSHRGWYSFVITTATSFVYAFGFIQLVPQLIINYKLKSVAHLPMKALTYKALNTVVDDFFSFVVRMPLLHRLACFRDDVVFVILLYQYWIYPVDKKRINEYGQTFDPATEAAEKSEPEKEDAKAKVVQESRKDR